MKICNVWDFKKQNPTLGEINSRLDSKRKDFKTWKHSRRNYLKLFRVKYDWKKSGQSFSELWINFKQSDVGTVGVLKGEEMGVRVEGEKKKSILYFHISSGHLETGANSSSNLMKITNPQVQEVQWTPRTRNMKRITPRHILNQIALSQWFKKNILAHPDRGKGHVTYKGAQIKMTGNFSLKTMGTRRQWSNIFNIVKGTR